MVFELVLMETLKLLRNGIISWKVKTGSLQRYLGEFHSLAPASSTAAGWPGAWSLVGLTARSCRHSGKGWVLPRWGLLRQPCVVSRRSSRSATEWARPSGEEATNQWNVCNVLVLGIIPGLKITKPLCGRMPASPHTGIWRCGEMLGSMWQTPDHTSTEGSKTLCVRLEELVESHKLGKHNFENQAYGSVYSKITRRKI